MLLTNKNEMSNYYIFKESEIEDLKKQIRKELHSYKNSIEETIKLDDENNKGFVSLEGLKESFEIMEIKMNDRLEEFMYYFLFLKSQNIEWIEYKPLIDLISQPVVESNVDKRPIQNTKKVIEEVKKSKSESENYEDDYEDDIVEEEEIKAPPKKKDTSSSSSSPYKQSTNKP